LDFPNRVLRTRFHRVVFNDRGTSRHCLLPPMAVKSKPPALRVVVDPAVFTTNIIQFRLKFPIFNPTRVSNIRFLKELIL
jgi:hypothetical protein